MASAARSTHPSAAEAARILDARRRDALEEGVRNFGRLLTPEAEECVLLFAKASPDVQAAIVKHIRDERARNSIRRGLEPSRAHRAILDLRRGRLVIWVGSPDPEAVRAAVCAGLAGEGVEATPGSGTSIRARRPPGEGGAKERSWDVEFQADGGRTRMRVDVCA